MASDHFQTKSEAASLPVNRSDVLQLAFVLQNAVGLRACFHGHR
jgi:hypothetical protein